MDNKSFLVFIIICCVLLGIICFRTFQSIRPDILEYRKAVIDVDKKSKDHIKLIKI